MCQDGGRCVRKVRVCQDGVICVRIEGDVWKGGRWPGRRRHVCHEGRVVWCVRKVGSVSGRMEDLLVSTDKSAVGSHLMLCILLLWL